MAQKSIFDMTDQEIIDNYEPLFDFFIRPAYYRVAGMAFIHMNIKAVRRFIEAETRVGKYGGRIETTSLEPRQFYWRDIKLAPTIRTDYNVSGPLYGVNTWIGKVGFWSLWLDRVPIIQTILRPRR